MMNQTTSLGRTCFPKLIPKLRSLNLSTPENSEIIPYNFHILQHNPTIFTAQGPLQSAAGSRDHPGELGWRLDIGAAHHP